MTDIIWDENNIPPTSDMLDITLEKYVAQIKASTLEHAAKRIRAFAFALEVSRDRGLPDPVMALLDAAEKVRALANGETDDLRAPALRSEAGDLDAAGPAVADAGVGQAQVQATGET